MEKEFSRRKCKEALKEIKLEISAEEMLRLLAFMRVADPKEKVAKFFDLDNCSSCEELCECFFCEKCLRKFCEWCFDCCRRVCIECVQEWRKCSVRDNWYRRKIENCNCQGTTSPTPSLSTSLPGVMGTAKSPPFSSSSEDTRVVEGCPGHKGCCTC